ncbi:hypothetical protein GCM10011575_00070 [Microlunatus endophyticus]|uniref:Uncharacterized protein n=1 Tax=Microlunatus endophyticus TaxID=1716077 RepID=A0A917RZ48_9ACTN|nr:HicB family toxin-antitoxin system [Microlunatus endophyticus]GGL46104.1 hypothetical protein GCM10011575_00070 [Microlunatus endophyticus]
MSNHTATVMRDGELWIIEVVDLESVTQARVLGDAELAARELIAVSTGSALEDVTVDLEVLVLGVSRLTERLDKIRNEREHAAALEADAADEK